VQGFVDNLQPVDESREATDIEVRYGNNVYVVRMMDGAPHIMIPAMGYCAGDSYLTSGEKQSILALARNTLSEGIVANASGQECGSGAQCSSTRTIGDESVGAAVERRAAHGIANDRKTLKKSAIQQNRYLIKQLPPISQRHIGHFIDQVQERCAHLTPKDLFRTIEIFGKLEQGRSGYDLLRQLAACSAEDLETWNSLMQQWTATNAEIVLNELARRLTILKDLQELIRDKRADELHQLQPLFERGLWMFGPEYESVEFTSNRSMTTIVRDFFQRRGIYASRSRPDFVVLPDSTVGLYCADEFTNGEVSGTRKILIVELKRGGFCLTQNEIDQARDYARELRTTGCAQPTTEIEAYVLGASLEPTLQEMRIGDRTLVRPCPYDLILNRAHARTFNLQKRIQETAPRLTQDEEITDALADSSFDFEGGSS
jgi:hypothetical protein